jgi:hypothetical protein
VCRAGCPQPGERRTALDLHPARANRWRRPFRPVLALRSGRANLGATALRC